jgi:AcrR family transcriptional regulator
VQVRSDRKPPARRPRISREYLDGVRRRRYVDAVAELLHEFGRGELTVTNIVRLAKTARNSFYEVFGGVEDCVGYGVGAAAEEIFAGLEDQDGEGEWLAEVHEAIVGFYATVAANPILAELFLVHAASARSDHGRAAARAGGERFIPLLRRGRVEAEERGRPSLPATAEEYFSLAIVSLAAQRVRDPEVEDLPAEARALARLVGGFYLGPEGADEILGSPASGLSVS